MSAAKNVTVDECAFVPVNLHRFQDLISVGEISMEDFPWEIFKGQTLQNLSQELGLTRDLAKDEAVGFLKAVQRKGCMCSFSFRFQVVIDHLSRMCHNNDCYSLSVGPALTEEITKDLATGGPAKSNKTGMPNLHSLTARRGKLCLQLLHVVSQRGNDRLLSLSLSKVQPKMRALKKDQAMCGKNAEAP